MREEWEEGGRKEVREEETMIKRESLPGLQSLPEQTTGWGEDPLAGA